MCERGRGLQQRGIKIVALCSRLMRIPSCPSGDFCEGDIHTNNKAEHLPGLNFLLLSDPSTRDLINFTRSDILMVTVLYYCILESPTQYV